MPTKNTTIAFESSPNRKARLARKRGQSVIEFAIVSMVFVSMLFLSYNAVMAFAFQQYVAHAVFMSARAYQAAQANPLEQELRANNTLENYLPGLQSKKIRLGNSSIRADVISVQMPSALGVPMGSGKPTDAGTAIRVVFEMPLTALPLGSGDWDSVKKIRLEASSFLGREPTNAECVNYFSRLLKTLTLPNAPTWHKAAMENMRTAYAMTDNGC